MKRFLLAFLLILATWSASAQVVFPPHIRQYYYFTGGPIATLGSVTGGTGYNASATCTGVALTDTTTTGPNGLAPTGAAATITTNSSGVVTTVTLTAGGAPTVETGGPGAPAANSGIGANGYIIGDVLTNATSACLGVGTGFTVPVATITTYSFLTPSGVSLIYADMIDGGSGGGAGGSGSGGGGAGGAHSCLALPLVIPQGTSLTLQVGQHGIGAVFGGAGAIAPTLSTITGAITPIAPSAASAAGGTGSGTAGANGGGGGPVGQGGGAAAGANMGLSPNFFSTSPCQGGPGGGGGGTSASTGGNGGRMTGFSGGATGAGNGSGGGGGATLLGVGGKGGDGTSPTNGNPPTIGWGGGGGGGGIGKSGGNGGDGMIGLSW